MAWIAGVQRALSEGGRKVLITRGLRKLVSPVAHVGILVFSEVDLTKPLPAVPPLPGIEAREAVIEDASLFSDPTVFLTRFKRGDRCFVGIEADSGELTNYRWISHSPSHIPELNRYLIPEPDTVYSYDLVTLPEFRRRGIDSYTRRYTYSHLQQAGIRKVYAYIHGDNRPSLKSARRFHRQVGRVAYLQLRGFEPIMFGGNKRGIPELRRLSPLRGSSLM